MIGYIRILKKQIANEMQINRHIKASSHTDEESGLISPHTVNNKIKGLKRNTWVILLIFIATLYGLAMHDFWVSQTMMLIISTLLLLNIYTNSHNIHNHQRWLMGLSLLDKNEYFSLFKKKPAYCLLNSIFSHQGEIK